MERPEPHLDFDLSDREGEVWLPIPGYEGFYVASNHGRIKGVGRKVTLTDKRESRGTYTKAWASKILKGHLSERKGYEYVQLVVQKNKTKKSTRAHILVALAFHPNPENKPQVNHKDGVKHHNWPSNLEWATRSENLKHAFSIGLMSNEGSKNPASKLTEDQVREIRRLFVGREKKYEVYQEIGDKFKVSKTTVWEIITNKIYKKVA